MTPQEQAILEAARRLAQARDAQGVVRLLAGELDALFAGGRTRAFVGQAFDGYARALLAAAGHGEATLAEVRRLCARSREAFGEQPWTHLYEACLQHLAGQDEAAAALYALAARDAGVLWGSSVGCRSVLAPYERGRMLADPPAVAPLELAARGRPSPGVLLVSCDEAYLQRHGPAYIRSLDQHGGETGLHLHVVNPAADVTSTVRTLAGGLWPRVSLSVETYRGPDPRAYFALARLLRLRQVMQLHGCPVLVTDIDAAFTAPLDVAAALGPDREVGLRFKRSDFHAHPWNTIQANALLVGDGPHGRAFATALQALSAALFHERAGAGLWFIDQNLLFATSRLFDDQAFADLSRSPLPGGLRFGKDL